MTDPRVPLKNPGLAAVLAFLVPGLGHAYQGRLFKAVLYCVCILGTFFGGMALGDWQPVYYRMDADHSRFSYFSQVMVGVPALPALVQKARYERDSEIGASGGLDDGDPLEAEFAGLLLQRGGEQVPVQGNIALSQQAESISGTFTGSSLEDGAPVSLTLSSPMTLQQKVYPSRARDLECMVVDDAGQMVGTLRGYVPRPFWDWYQVPLGGPNGDGTYDNTALATVHGRLGKQFDLASVFTWIAGLLNVLAIWDAFEGPAYGYGDETSEESGRKREGEPDQDKSSAEDTARAAQSSETADQPGGEG